MTAYSRWMKIVILGFGVLASGCAGSFTHSPDTSSENFHRWTKSVGSDFGLSFFGSRFVTNYLRDHKHLYVEVFPLENGSPMVFRRTDYFKEEIEKTIVDSDTIVLVAAQAETRTLASEERLYQMNHARARRIHEPEHQSGADIALVGSIRCMTWGSVPERITTEYLKAVDLSNNEIVWVSKREVQQKLPLTQSQTAQFLLDAERFGDPCGRKLPVVVNTDTRREAYKAIVRSLTSTR